MKYKFQKGFSLIETILVLAIATIVSFLAIQQSAKNAEFATAELEGQQLQFVSNAFNGYIAANYRSLITYNPSGALKDPQTSCTYTSSTSNVCEVLPADFSNAFITPGFMPVGSTNATTYNSTYHFYVRRVGVAPNLFAEGLIITNNPLTLGSPNPRYDLIGAVLSNAGITSGEIPSATVNATPNFQTVSGAYTLTSADFPIGTTRGVYGNYLKFQQYSEYLRRDGTLPMTGNLDMGGLNPENPTVGHLLDTNSVNSPAGTTVAINGDQGVIINASNGQPFTVNANQTNFSGDINAINGNFTGNVRVTQDIYGTNINATNNIVAGNKISVGNATISNPSGAVASFNGGVEADDVFLRSRGGIALSVALPYYSSRGAFLVQDASQIQFPNCQAAPSSGVTPSYPSDIGSPNGIGSAKIIVTPANILALGVTDNNTYETGVTFIAEADTTTRSGWWTVHLSTTDPYTNTPYGNGLQGIAHIYCVYGN